MNHPEVVGASKPSKHWATETSPTSQGLPESSRHIRGKQSQHLAWAALSLMSKIKEGLFFLLSLLTGPRPKGVRNWLVSWGGTEEEKSEVEKRGETPKLVLHGEASPRWGREG